MDARGEPQQGLERGHRGAPAVEPKGELVQVGLEVIVTDAVMGAPQPGLEVAKDSVDVRQELRRPLGGALGAGAMPVAHVRQRRVSPPAIRQNQVPSATVRFTNPVSERADASGTAWRRTRPAALPRTSTAPTTNAFSRSWRPPFKPASGPPRYISSTSTLSLRASRSGFTMALRSLCRSAQAVS